MIIQISKINYPVSPVWNDYTVERLAQTLIADKVINDILQAYEGIPQGDVLMQVQASLKQSLIISLANCFDCSEKMRLQAAEKMALCEISVLLQMYIEVKNSLPDINAWLESIEPKDETKYKRQTYYIQPVLVATNELINKKGKNLFEYLNWLPFVLSVRKKDWLYEGQVLTQRQYSKLTTGEKITCIAEHTSLNEQRVKGVYDAPAGLFMPLIKHFIGIMAGIGEIMVKYSQEGNASGKSDEYGMENAKHEVARFLGVQLPEIQIMYLENYVKAYDRMMQQERKK